LAFGGDNSGQDVWNGLGQGISSMVTDAN
jgi:hypothetical protein